MARQSPDHPRDRYDVQAHHVGGHLIVGSNNVVQTGRPVIGSELDGGWAWRIGRPAGVAEFSFRVRGGMGVCTRTNAPTVFSVGDVIFVATRMEDTVVEGQLMFTDGYWKHVLGKMSRDRIRFAGGGWNWIMSRIG